MSIRKWDSWQRSFFEKSHWTWKVSNYLSAAYTIHNTYIFLMTFNNPFCVVHVSLSNVLVSLPLRYRLPFALHIFGLLNSSTIHPSSIWNWCRSHARIVYIYTVRCTICTQYTWCMNMIYIRLHSSVDDVWCWNTKFICRMHFHVSR